VNRTRIAAVTTGPAEAGAHPPWGALPDQDVPSFDFPKPDCKEPDGSA